MTITWQGVRDMGNAVVQVVRKLLLRRRRTFRFGSFAIGEREMRDIGGLFR